MAENKQGYFLGGIIGSLVGKAILPKLFGGAVGSFLPGILGSVIASSLLKPKGSGSKESVAEKLAKFNAAPETEDPYKNLYKSQYTDPETGISPQFDTAEERDAYDRDFEKRYGGQPAVATPYKGLAMGGMADSGIGGLIQGPGTVTSDSIPGGIMQNGKKVEEILVSNGEVIFSGKDLENLDPDGNIERAGQRLGNAPNGTRGAEAARMYAEVQSA